MGARIKGIFGKVREAVGKLGKAVKIAIVAVLVLAVAAGVFLVVRNSQKPYTTLFTELSSDDMTAVLSYLDQNGVTDYKVENNDTVLVREGQEDELRARIYMQGFPTSGFNYGTYLDNIGMLSSESDHAALKLYELMDRLSANVRFFEGVKDAHVLITEETDNSFILTDNVVHAKASVTVEMLGGARMSDQLVKAIRNMVSHGAQGVEISDVVISDTYGTTYDGEEDATTTVANTAELKLALEAQVDKNVRSKIMEQLLPMFGANNLSVSVTSSVDVSDTYSEEMIYLEPEWAQDGSSSGQGIIGSRVWGNYLVRDGGVEGAGGVVGTTTNADLNEYVVREGDLTGNETEINTSGEVNYDVSYRRTQTRPMGVVRDLSVAVAINSAVSENTIDTTPLLSLVGRAAGISTEYQAEKIAIVVYPFYREPVPEENEPGAEPGEEAETTFFGLPRWVLFAAAGGLALFVIILVLALILRRNKKKKQKLKEEEERQQMIASLTPEQLEQFTPEQLASLSAEQIAQFTADMAEISTATGANSSDIMDLHTERSMELRRDVRQFAEDNPAIAAQMIKNWLRGDEDNA